MESERETQEMEQLRASLQRYQRNEATIKRTLLQAGELDALCCIERVVYNDEEQPEDLLDRPSTLRDEIERLTAENERLRASLGWVRDEAQRDRESAGEMKRDLLITIPSFVDAALAAKERPVMERERETQGAAPINDDIEQLRGALLAIRRSSAMDFETPLLWGQWCREVATDATVQQRSVPGES